MNIYGMIFIVVFLGLAAGVAVLLLRLTGKEVRTGATSPSEKNKMGGTSNRATYGCFRLVAIPRCRRAIPQVLAAFKEDALIPSIMLWLKILEESNSSSP